MGKDRVPEGLAASDWSGICEAYEANRHAAFAADGGYQARNPGQGWVTRFDGRGFETTPDGGGWTWGLELVSFGAASVGAVTPVSNRCGQRVEYDWDDTLTEWYVNDARGLEHGFTMHRRPNGNRDASSDQSPGAIDQSPDHKGGVGARQRGPSQSQAHRSLTVAALKDATPLRLTLAVRGNLRPRVEGEGRCVSFVNDAGAAVVNYSGLTVFDANGAAVPAWIEVPDFNSSFAIGHSSFLSIVLDDAEAVYPLTIDPIAQQAYLKASNTGHDDQFGASVAVSGDTVVVGAWQEDSNATGVNGDQANNSAIDSGAAYVFVRNGGVWSQQAYLKASNTEAGDNFGNSIAASGNTVVVGAWREDNSAFNSGAAYVFVRDAGGVWSQQAFLNASNAGDNDRFGRSVAICGDTLVVGAHNEASIASGVDGDQADNSAIFAGAAYVFVRDAGGVWSQQAYLKASNTDVRDNFGISVAVSDDTVVVGAFGEDSSATGVEGNQADNSAGASGAAYVFVRSGGVWSQQAYLKASNTGGGDGFGISVAASGDTVVVGAWGNGM